MGSNGPDPFIGRAKPVPPKAGKGGGGAHKSGNGCAVTALALAGGALTLVATFGYGLKELFQSLTS